MRMASEKYRSGDTVMARWPGSHLYYEVKVLSFDAQSQLYTVIYKDGTELELREADIRSEERFRSGRRSRSRSPARRRSRSRSPARTARRSSSSRTAAAEPPASRRDAAPKEGQEAKPAENNRKSTHQQKEENDSANRVNQKGDGESEKKVEIRYNLRRRKDDGDAKPAAQQPQPKEEEEEQEEKPAATLPPKTTHLEFGGRMGVLFMLLLLPSTVLVLLLLGGQENSSLGGFPPALPPPHALWDRTALTTVALWFLGQALLYLLPVGKVVEGLPLKTGERLSYRTNGFHALVLTAVALGAALHQEVDLTYIHSHFLQLAAAATLFSVLLSLYLYTRSRWAADQDLAPGGNSGHVIYDFFMGRELNPRIRSFDLKYFCEMRPGLIGWVVVNLSMALAEMKVQQLDSPSPAMILVNCFQLLYVLDGLWHEEAILTTMDIVQEGFGFMLAFGDLVWVPFTYSLQAYYLVSHPSPLAAPWMAAIVTLNALGYYIFRKANSQKNCFRRNPSDPKLAHLKTIPTATGKSLLVSGWWGVVRHPNYLGDLIMALAWSLPCGFSHLLPYYYVTYFLVLLVHREARDEAQCRRKYGSAWDDYCRAVPYRIFPRVY